MKKFHLTAVLFSSLIGASLAHADNMNGMDMSSMPAKNAAKPGQMDAKIHHATGVVKKVDMAKNRVTIEHGPVDSLHWPAMTMSFAMQDSKMFDKLAAGEKVKFELAEKTKGRYIVTKIAPVK